MAIKFLDEEQQAPGKVVFIDEPVAKPTPPTPKVETEFDRQQKASDIMAGTGDIPEAPEEQPKFSWQQLTTDDSLQTIQRDFLKARTGKDYTSIAGEDLSKEFMSTMRQDEWNTFSGIAFLNKLRNSPGDAKEKLALGRLVAERTKTALQEGGQPGAKPYVDMLGAALTDFTNYIGLGVGAIGKKVATKAATEAAIKGAVPKLISPAAKAIGATAATEAVIGAGQDVVQQKGEIASSSVLAERRPDLGVEKKEFSYMQTGAAALMSGVMGFVEAKGQMALKPGRTGQEQLNDLLQEKIKVPTDPNAAPTKAERVLTDAVSQNMDTVVEEFMNIQGGRILDDINPATALTDAKIQKDLSGRAVRVALYVMEQDPTFRVKPNQKVSTAIAEVFSNLNNIDDVVLEQAIRKEGLTPEEFAQANKLTVTEAAQVMQQYSAASKAMARLSEIDPVFKKQADLLFGKPDEYTSALGRVGQMVENLERESKAWVVSGIGTTVRNIIGTGVGLTFNSAASLIEGSLYTLGRTAKAAVDPSSSTLDTLKRGIGDTMKDAFGVYGHLARGGLSAATTDKLLQHNPTLHNNILSATQENATKDISKVAKVFNSLNAAQDAFFRRAVFNASVEKHMRKLGLDMYEVVANGQNIPASVLKEATDETLKATFSYTPKQQKQGVKSFESGAEAMGNLFIKAAEFPGGSLFATFPRFMSNAIAFQYRYSVFGGASGASDILAGAMKINAGDEAGRTLVNKGMENFSKGIVGTAALAAAYDYRMNNQDSEWYNVKNDDGSTTDVRALFPLGPYLAVGDFLAKKKQGLEPKTAEMMEAIVGMKMPAGTQGQMMDQIFAAFSSEKDAAKTELAIAKTLGDFTARFSAPFVFKSAYEFLDLFREEGAIQRDPNVITSEGGVDRFIEAATNRVQSKLPIVKESLPAAVPRLREGPVYKEGEFFNTFVGVREVPEKTPQEKEIIRLGIDPYQLYGPSSGDKQYDRAYVENANPLVIRTIERVMANERYQQLPILEQKQALTNSVRDILSVARNKTDGKFSAEDRGRIKKIQFNKLPSETRKIINDRYAKDNNGVTLEEANDYKAIDKYQALLNNLQFATGGVVPKLAGGGILAKEVGKEVAEKVGAKAIGKAGADIVANPSLLLKKEATTAEDEAIDNIVEKNITKQSSSVFDQMSGVLQGKPVQKKAAPATSKPSIAAQTEEAIPAPTKAGRAAETPDIESTMYDDIDYETQMYNEDPTLNMSYDFDHLSPMDPANVGKGVVGTPVDKFTSIGGIDGAIGIVRKERTEAFDKLRGDPDFLDFDDSVLSTTLAKYREKDSAHLSEMMALPAERRSPFYAPEFNIETANEDQINTFFKMANVEQKKLDSLRKKYGDRPAVTLFHGQEEGTKVMQNLTKKGFSAPQEDVRKHAELSVGAPSFTKDPNLNALIPKFGGEDVKAYGSVSIPYADYLYRRVNMPAATYDLANRSRGGDPLDALNVYNRAITGTDDNAVPISLPKNYHLESEDMFIEADKLKNMGFSRPAAKGGDKEALKQLVKAVDKKNITDYNLNTVGAAYDQLKKGADTKRLSEKDVYVAYNTVRKLFKEELNRPVGSVSVTGGAGSRYVNTIRTLAEGTDLFVPAAGGNKTMIDVLTDLESAMSSLAKRKNNKALTEKADNIAQLRDLLTNIREQTTNAVGDVTPSSVKAEEFTGGKIPINKMPLVKNINDLRRQRDKLVEKRSKEWEEETIDAITQQIQDLEDNIEAKKKVLGPIESERASKDKIMKLTDKLAKGGFIAKRR